jgi:hypothetical protein
MGKLTFAERAWEEYLYWQENDKKLKMAVKCSFWNAAVYVKRFVFIVL